MAAIQKPINRAFILNSKKSNDFLKQDNNQFKNVMSKFEKFTKKSHSISNK